jgi:anti-sigma factor RsiW
MTSEQARELFSAAVDAELAADERAAFEAALIADPQLARDYASFGAMFGRARPVDAADAAAVDAAPDLLGGIQRKLRERSRGRFYADRFAERLGAGFLQPWTLALILLGALALLWFGASLFEGAALVPHGTP